MVDVKDMTVEAMDAWAANAYSLMKVTEQEAEAKAFYRCGEFIRELGKRIEKLNASVTNWNRENEGNVKRVAALIAIMEEAVVLIEQDHQHAICARELLINELEEQKE